MFHTCHFHSLFLHNSDLSCSSLVYEGLPGEKGERGSPGNGIRGQRGPGGPPGNTDYPYLGKTAHLSWIKMSQEHK